MSGPYVLKRHGGGRAYVAAPGSSKSYTANALRARRFPSIEAALAEACGNESPVELFSE